MPSLFLSLILALPSVALGQDTSGLLAASETNRQSLIATAASTPGEVHIDPGQRRGADRL
jgi:hypothetical protein